MGAGDLASSKFQTGLNMRSILYEKTHSLLTNMFNELVDDSIPGSIFETPIFFANPTKETVEALKYNTEKIYDTDKALRNMQLKINFLNISFETFRNYHFLWYAYNNFEGKEFQKGERINVKQITKIS